MQEKDIFYKDVMEAEDCNACPAYTEEICKGGWTSTPSGEPLEPPCCGWSEDENVTEWVSNRLRYMY